MLFTKWKWLSIIMYTIYYIMYTILKKHKKNIDNNNKVWYFKYY